MEGASTCRKVFGFCGADFPARTLIVGRTKFFIIGFGQYVRDAARAFGQAFDAIESGRVQNRADARALQGRAKIVNAAKGQVCCTAPRTIAQKMARFVSELQSATRGFDIARGFERAH